MPSSNASKNRIINLAKVAGLPIRLSNGSIASDNSVSKESLSFRTLEEARPYLRDKDASSKLAKIYAMYRGICKKSDLAKFKEFGLRYDITVIYPGNIGDEFTKTVGHSHENKPKTKLSYPEIYEVLDGHGVFLFQKSKNDSVNQIFAILAKPQDKIIVPPGFGHVTINLDKTSFVIANIFSNRAKSIYWNIKEHKGEGYYLLDGNDQPNIRIVVEKNKKYKKVSSLRWATPKSAFKISSKNSLYESFIKNPQKFDFLNNPEKHLKDLDPKNLFKLI